MPGRVQAGRRLVEQQQLRVAQQRAGDPQPLAHAVRVAADLVARPVGEVDGVQRSIDPAGGTIAVERGDELEIAPAAHVRIEARRLDEPGDAVERAHAVDQRVAPEELDCALVGADEPEQHPHRRRLAGAVGPEIAIDVTAADRQVDVVDRGDPAVALDEPARLDRWRARIRRAPHRRSRAAFSAATGGTEPATT